jgi:hypothetical protein
MDITLSHPIKRGAPQSPPTRSTTFHSKRPATYNVQSVPDHFDFGSSTNANTNSKKPRYTKKISNPLFSLPTADAVNPQLHLVIRSTTNKNLSSISIFAQGKALRSAGDGRNPKRVSPQSDGSLHVVCAMMEQSTGLLKMKKLAVIDVEVSSNTYLNQSKGVITSSDLNSCTEAELVEGLASQKVIQAHRLKRRVNNSLVDSASIVLTFNHPDIPQSIDVEWLRLPVKPYIEQPRRCRKCQLYGHGPTSCTRVEICYRCGLQRHTTEEEKCFDTAKCYHCQGSHCTAWKGCPTYKFEQEVCSYRALYKLSRRDAVTEVINLNIFPALAYAKVAGKRHVTHVPEHVTIPNINVSQQSRPTVTPVLNKNSQQSTFHISSDSQSIEDSMENEISKARNPSAQKPFSIPSLAKVLQPPKQIRNNLPQNPDHDYLTPSGKQDRTKLTSSSNRERSRSRSTHHKPPDSDSKSHRSTSTSRKHHTHTRSPSPLRKNSQ